MNLMLPLISFYYFSVKQFEKAMTPDEKSKLYQAIDYQENTAPTYLPIDFVATECHFTLGCLLFHVTDDKIDVLTSRLNHVQASFKQRPSANSLKYAFFGFGSSDLLLRFT